MSKIAFVALAMLSLGACNSKKVAKNVIIRMNVRIDTLQVVTSQDGQYCYVEDQVPVAPGDTIECTWVAR